MKTVNHISPLAPILPSANRVRHIPSRKRRHQRQPAPRKRQDNDDSTQQDNDRPHIDEYA